MPTPECCPCLQGRQQQLISLELRNLELRLESKLVSKAELQAVESGVKASFKELKDEVKEWKDGLKAELKDFKDEVNRNLGLLSVAVLIYAYFALFNK